MTGATDRVVLFLGGIVCGWLLSISASAAKQLWRRRQRRLQHEIDRDAYRKAKLTRSSTQ